VLRAWLDVIFGVGDAVAADTVGSNSRRVKASRVHTVGEAGGVWGVVPANAAGSTTALTTVLTRLAITPAGCLAGLLGGAESAGPGDVTATAATDTAGGEADSWGPKRSSSTDWATGSAEGLDVAAAAFEPPV
jgi:hypothetical protein